MESENTLYYGDNLKVLRDYIKDESVDLIYLDPPFNSKANYNLLFKEQNGSQSESQITAFEDTWHWTEETERTFQDIVDTAREELSSRYHRDDGTNVPTWGRYCEDIGISKRTANRWLFRYDPESGTIHFTSKSNEFHTPSVYTEQIEKLFNGRIDLDPCSNEGIPNIPSDKQFTKNDDGLIQPWYGSVYMNPPYGQEIKKWVNKLVSEYRQQNIVEAIALLPSRTDTEWYYQLRDFPRCFISGRISFIGQENSAPFPSMFVYLGKRIKEFINSFECFGDIYTRIQTEKIESERAKERQREHGNTAPGKQKTLVENLPQSGSNRSVMENLPGLVTGRK